jgi:hypothetical protein
MSYKEHDWYIRDVNDDRRQSSCHLYFSRCNDLIGTASDTESLAISHSALTGWESYRFLIKLLNMMLTDGAG